MDFLEISELYHHGIKDQKWGVRRYQYEDGSLTPAGKERYYEKYNYSSSSGSEGTSRKWVFDAGISKNQMNQIKSKAEQLNNMIPKELKNKPDKKIYSEKYKDIPTKELQDRIARISAERTYSDLVGDTKIKKNGWRITGEILQSVGAIAGGAAAVFTAYEAIKKVNGG